MGKNLGKKEAVNSKPKESFKSLDIPVISSFIEEDIGECVQMTPQETHKNKVTKKRKLPEENSKECGTGDGNASKGVKKNKSKTAMSPSLNIKKKKARKNLPNSDMERYKQNNIKKPSSKSHEDHCSPTFIKHFKAVKKQTKDINSLGSLRKFLEREKKNRREKVNSRVSVLLKKADWQEFAKFVRARLEKLKGLSNIDSSDGEALQQLLTKTRVRVKFWLLFPHLKGRKPENWKSVLENMTT